MEAVLSFCQEKLRMNKTRRSIRELNLLDDFLFTESMQHKETAIPIAKMIIERATGVKVKHLEIECQKTVNGVDTEYHGIRLDFTI